jgi:acyl-coenzyme A synthetase/AMP-(fatty) acid ligase
MQHPDVHDAAVIGVDLNNGMGEVPKAFFVPMPGVDVSVANLKKFIEGRLAKYKHPQDIVFISAVPKIPTGKILRRSLRQEAKAEEQKSFMTKRGLYSWIKILSPVFLAALTMFALLALKISS